MTNFRNLLDVDIPLAGNAVIVGENRSGKSNLLHALRLVLDPSLSSVQRTLTADDFSEALGADPMADGATIEVSVEIDDFDDDEGLVAALSPALLSGDPMRARLTYRFAPRDDETDETDEDVPAYEWSIYGGEDVNRRISGELRNYLHHVHMHALRDAEGDISSWRRSPLRPILEDVSRTTAPKDLVAVANALEEANRAVRNLGTVKTAATQIERHTEALVGQLHRVEPSLDLAPADPERTLRALRLYVDGSAQRQLGSASLGTLNVLYIALLQLEMARRLDKGDIEHILISIEEPEAHLHPHLQRRMFAGLLAGGDQDRSTIVATHSPHIVSVTPPRQLVVLRDEDRLTKAFAASEADLDDDAWDDLSRYLDATRSELVFARRVLLVEGFAEQVLLPRLAPTGVDFDEHGITVCAIHGTHFLSYVAFLQALGTPHAVVTDGDPDAGTGRTGPERAARLARDLGASGTDPEDLGIFCGDVTIEVDIFDTSHENEAAMFDALETFPLGVRTAARVAKARAQGGIPGTDFLPFIEPWSKGRYAQRLAGSVESLDAPDYIERAIAYLMT